MPISKYFQGKGEEVAAKLKARYGKKWKNYFYGLANKWKQKPKEK